MNNSLKSLLRDERGQSMVEYGVAVALVSAVATVRDLRASLREVSAAGGVQMTRRYALGLVVACGAVVALGAITFDTSPLIPLFALVLSAALCTAAAHAMGETDNTPAGPLGGVAQLVVGSVAPGGTAVAHSGQTPEVWMTGCRPVVYAAFA